MSTKQRDVRRLIFVVTGEPETFEYDAVGKNGPYKGKVFKVNVQIAQIDRGYEPGTYELVHFGFNPPDIMTGDKYEADLEVGEYQGKPQVTIVKDRQKHSPVYLKMILRLPPKKQVATTLDDAFESVPAKTEPAKVDRGPPADRLAPDTIVAQKVKSMGFGRELTMEDIDRAQDEIDAKKTKKINWLPLDQKQPAANVVKSQAADADTVVKETEHGVSIVEGSQTIKGPDQEGSDYASGGLVPSAKEMDTGIEKIVKGKKLTTQEQRDTEDVKAAFRKAEKDKLPTDPALAGQIDKLWQMVLKGDETMGHKYRPPIGIYRASSSSTLKDCMRRAMLDRNWEKIFKDNKSIYNMVTLNYEPKIGEHFGPAMMGTGVHELLQSRLEFSREGWTGRGANAHPVLGMEEEVSLERDGIKMVGHYDILVRFEGEKYVHDIKSYNSKWGNTFNDKKGHQTQLALMQAALGGIGGVLWYIGRNAGESDPYLHPWNEDTEVLVDGFFKLAKELHEFEKELKTPPRLPDSFRREGASELSVPKKQHEEFPCRRRTASPSYKCEFWEVCWQGGRTDDEQLIYLTEGGPNSKP